MADNADRGRKSLIVMVLTFLMMGGGVFGFLIWNGLQDMQDVKFRSYGSGVVGRATLPLLKYFGFVDDETPEGAAKDEFALKVEKAIKEGGAEAAASAAGASATGQSPKKPRSSSYGRGGSPKFSASLSGAGAVKGSGGSKSFSSFSGSGDSGGLKLSGRSGSGSGAAAKGGKTMDALKASTGHLAAATNTNSALTAKSRWDQGFGVKHGQGGSGQMSSYNKAAATLDHIETGEVGSLKMGDPSTLDVPDVGTPKAVKGEETAADKAKDAIKKNVADQIAKSLLGGMTSGGNANSPQQESPEMPPEMESYIKDQLAFDGIDTDFDYVAKSCSTGCPEGVAEGQQYYDVTFNGQGEDLGLSSKCAVFALQGGGYDATCF